MNVNFSRPGWRAPVALFALALAARLVMLGLANDWLWYGGMSTHFGIGAAYLAEGRGYAISRELSERLSADQTRAGRLLDLEEYRRPLPADAYLTLERPPGYSWLLALTYRVTGEHRYGIVKGLQAIGDSFVSLILLSLLRPWSAFAGFVAGVLYAVWPPVVRNAVMVLPESLVPLSVAAGAWLVVRAISTRGLAWAVLAGLVNGAAAYLRTEVLLLGLALLPALWLGLRSLARAVVAAIVITGVTGAVIAPWVARNYRLTGEYLLTSSVGPALWVGLGEYPNRFGIVPDVKVIEQELERRGIVDHVEQDRVLRARFLAAVREDPLRYVAATLRRFVRYLFPRTDWGLVGLYSRSLTFEEIKAQGGGVWSFLRAAPLLFALKLGPWLIDGAIVVAALAGGGIGLRAGWPTSAVLLTIPLYFIATRALLAYDPRHAVPGFWAYPGLVAIGIDAAAAWLSGAGTRAMRAAALGPRESR